MAHGQRRFVGSTRAYAAIKRSTWADYLFAFTQLLAGL
jgi:hypothetical protein